MSLLTGAQILGLIGSLKPPLIENYRSIRFQLQPAGFDLSLAKIMEPAKMPDEPVEFSRAKDFAEMMVEHDFKKPVQPFKPYRLVTNETINFPLNMTGMCITRSSLTRLGAVLGSGIIDAGFRGVLNFSLITPIAIKFKENDRFVQMMVEEHEPTFAYTGQFQQVLNTI